LAELLVSAASQLAAPTPAGFAPAGIPIRDGRVHLGRLRRILDGHERVVVVAGFATAVWIGPPAAPAPPLGRLDYRTDTMIDRRGRLVLDFRVRSWLDVADTRAFDAVIVGADGPGLLVIPVEGFAQRWEVLTR
jgi:hypothetical protein